MLGFLLLLVAGVLLLAGAELFAENATLAGRQLGVTGLAVGLLLAGAEPEELFTAVLATVQGRTAISVGDALGANVTMLTAVVGAAALVRGVPVGTRVSRYLLGATVSGVVAALTTLDATVTRLEGGGLLGFSVLLVAVVWKLEHAPPAVGELAELGEQIDQADAPHAAYGLLLALAGIAVMAMGGWAAVNGAVRVVAILGVADGAVGATFVALATTAELFALVWSAARREVEELAVAGIAGSAVYNATVTLGVPALIRPLDASDLRVAAGLPLGAEARKLLRVSQVCEPCCACCHLVGCVKDPRNILRGSFTQSSAAHQSRSTRTPTPRRLASARTSAAAAASCAATPTDLYSVS